MKMDKLTEESELIKLLKQKVEELQGKLQPDETTDSITAVRRLNRSIAATCSEKVEIEKLNDSPLRKEQSPK